MKTNLSPVAVDFEVYYDKHVSIKTLGVGGYLRHPKAKIYLVSVVGDDGEVYVGPPEDFDWFSLVGREIWSHNAAFDRRCYFYLKQRMSLGYDADGQPFVMYAMPDLETPLWKCSANLAVYNRAGRSLKAAVLDLLGEEITKDVRDAMLGVTVEEMHVRPAVIAPAQFATLYDEVCAYSVSDSAYCRRLGVTYGPWWPALEQALSTITICSCHVGLPLNLEKLETGKALLETRIWEAENRLPWVTGLVLPAEEIDGVQYPEVTIKGGKVPGSTKGLAEACRAYNIPHPPSTAQDDARCLLWEDTYGEEFPWVADMREVRKANRLLKAATLLLDRQHNGWFNYEMKYGGAHTLRWSGGSEKAGKNSGGRSFNVQNMPKKPAFGFDLRACIEAPPGYKFIIADLAQIEARICPYLAGDDETIEAVRAGMSIYEVHARQTMSWKGGVLKKEDPTKYALAKARVLALGFGCGWKKFQLMAATEKYGSLVLDDRTCKTCVREFRARKKIPNLWNRLENDLIASVGEDYECELPSGRILTNFDVRTALKVTTVTTAATTSLRMKTRPAYQARTSLGGRYTYLYGGLLVENLVQATARDVFGEAMVRLDAAGFQILFHVHDEVTLLVEETRRDAKKEVEQIMAITPSWLPGCPIGVEVTESAYYEK